MINKTDGDSSPAMNRASQEILTLNDRKNGSQPQSDHLKIDQSGIDARASANESAFTTGLPNMLNQPHNFKGSMPQASLN